MAGGNLQNVLFHMSRLMAGQRGGGSPDQELLTRFLEQRDEGAFTALLERHGAMVLGVCNRVLGNAQDAEDACQAVFLLLARKAASVRKPGSLASWLHGTAWRVARKLQAQLIRRRTHENLAAPQSAVSDPPDLSLREACRILDEELNRLPQHYKAPVVLCHLEGKSQDEAARELGWRLGVLRGRLERGRARLRLRLTRRGVTASAVLAATALGASPGFAAMPATLVIETAKASLGMTKGSTLQATVSPGVASLTRQALHELAMTNVRYAVAVCCSLAAVGLIMAWVTGFVIGGADTAVSVEPQKLELWSSGTRFQLPKGGVWCVAYSPDGTRLAVGSGGVLPEPGELRLWDATGKLLYALETFRPVRCVVFAPDSKKLATAEHDGMARLRDAETGDVLLTFRGHHSNIDTVAFSADGKSLATSSWDGTVKVWDTGTGQEIRTLGLNTKQVFTVAFGSDGLLASAGADGAVRIWQSGTGQARFILCGHDGTVHGLAFAPDGKTLASASWDKTVKLWDGTTGRLLTTLYGHTDPVLAVAFSPDGNALASCSGQWGTNKALQTGPKPGQVIVWDLKAQQARASMLQRDRVLGVAFSPDGKTLATAGFDGSVNLWKPEPAAETGQGSAPPAQPFQTSLTQPDGELKFVNAVDAAVDAREPDPNKHYRHEFHDSLKAKPKEGLLSYGPDASEQLRFESDGLRITLPAEVVIARPDGIKKPKAANPFKWPAGGLVTDFGVSGDFEITLAYDVLSIPQPLPRQNADISVVLVPDEPARPGVWHKANQNRASLSRETAGRDSQFVTRLTRWNETSVKDKWGNEVFTDKEKVAIKEFPATMTAGWLRLVRSGSVLFYYASEGAGTEFKLLHKEEFGTKDLKNVRIIATTHGSEASFDVRVSDLHVRADDLPKLARATPEPPAGLGWLAISLALAAMVLSFGTWLYVRGRRRAVLARAGRARAPSAGAGDSPALAFTCTSCGKRLKAKAGCAGRTVKCPRCGKDIAIPAIQPTDARSLS